MSLLTQASICITPNGYKEGKLYSVIPSDGSGDMSVVRATTATRVNSAGLVELVPYNLLTYSETFSNIIWVKNEATISSNIATAPNGTNTASKLIENTANDSHHIYQNAIANGVNTFSFYAKKGERTFVYAYADSVGQGKCFNLTSGTLGVNIISAPTNATIESVGNDWFRCTITLSISSASALRIGLCSADGTFSYLGNGTSGAFIWGAQLVEGSNALDYQRTETRLNIPRLDYSNGSCPSLLVEPQRTNISNYIESGTGNFNAATVTSATSILGLTTFNVVTDGILYGDSPHINSNSEFQANSTYTCSFYTDFTHCTGISISCNLLGFFPSLAFAVITINKTTKAITSNNVGGVWTINSSSATQINGEIYKISFTATPNLTSIAGSRTYIFGNLAGHFAGIQLEAGAYGTSFINKPTSASVTRNADVISKTGISSLIGQTEGTVFVEIDIDTSYAQSDMRFINVSDGSSDNWYFIGTNVSNEIRFYFRAISTTFVSSISPLTSGRHKLAFAYKNNDYVAYIDGVQVYNTTTLSVGGTSDIALGNSFGGNISKQFINASALFKTRLTNDQLELLTGDSFYTYAEMASYYNYTLQ